MEKSLVHRIDEKVIIPHNNGELNENSLEYIRNATFCKHISALAPKFLSMEKGAKTNNYMEVEFKGEFVTMPSEIFYKLVKLIDNIDE